MSYTRFDQENRAIARVVAKPEGKATRDTMAHALRAHRAAGDKARAKWLQGHYVYICGIIWKGENHV